MAFERGERPRSPAPKVRIVSGASLAPERRNVFYVVVHHVLDVSPVERRAGEPLEPILESLMLRPHRGRKDDAFPSGKSPQLLVRLGVVLYHALPKLPHPGINPLLSGQAAMRHFRHAALSGFPHEGAVAGADGGAGGLRAADKSDERQRSD
jgi:hypothetical protein